MSVMKILISETAENLSERAENQYKANCNEVWKAARADKDKRLNIQCMNIQKYHGELYMLVRNTNRKWQPRC